MGFRWGNVKHMTRAANNLRRARVIPPVFINAFTKYLTITIHVAIISSLILIYGRWIAVFIVQSP